MRRLRVDKAHPSNLLSAIEDDSEAQGGTFVPGWVFDRLSPSDLLTEDCGASDERLLALDEEIKRLVLLDDGRVSRCRCIPCMRDRGITDGFDPFYLDEKPILDAPLRLLLACLVALVWLTVLILSV